jgi:hypothetical protein
MDYSSVARPIKTNASHIRLVTLKVGEAFSFALGKRLKSIGDL